MAPKFRGNSDDWIDDENTKNRHTGTKAKKDIKARSAELPWEEGNAVVVEVFPKQCRVRLLGPLLGKGQPNHQIEILCSYRWAQLLGKGGEIRSRAPVAVGDRVRAVQSTPDTGVVEGLCVRRHTLSRVAPGRDNQSLHHVIAANVDCVVIVASIRDPEFSPGLVDRYLVAASAAGISACICATKKDLPTPPEVESILKLYREIGVSTFEVSAKTGIGIPELKQKLSSGETVFCGHSGVGKTSLLNALLGDSRKVAEVSLSTGKGRHTTTSAIMISVDDSLSRFWIDTPGVREFSLVGIAPEKLAQFFPEFNELPCTLKHSCLHLGEAECDASELPRHASYRRIYDSLLHET